MNAQSLSLFDVDASNFPTMKAKFYAFDAIGKQVRPSASELTLTENGQPRVITSVTCPPPPPPIAISSVLTVDVSGSMHNGSGETPNIDLAKAAAKVWIEGLPAGLSECALTSFDHLNYLNQDFTTDRSKLLHSLTTLKPYGGTDYDIGLLQPLAGSFQISQHGKYKRVVVFLSDGMPNSEPNSAVIISEAKKQNCMFFAVALGMPCPQSLRDIATQTGGLWYENVTTTPQAENVYRKIMQAALGNDPCEITWTSDVTCEEGNTSVQLHWQTQMATAYYLTPASSIISLKVTPPFVAFGKQLPSTQHDTTLTLTALNADFTVTGISRTFGSTVFSVVNTTFPITIPKNSRETITLRFVPSDSGITYASFQITTDKCSGSFSASGGYPGKKTKAPTLKLIQPNGGESYVVGSDTVIAWEGVGKSDTVSLDYSIDSGTTWKSIISRASTLQYRWKNIPKPVSTRCKVRVKQLTSEGNGNTDTEHFTLYGHTAMVTSVSWSPDGTKVVTGSLDGKAIIWDAVNGQRLLNIREFSSDFYVQVNAVAWSPDGTKLAIAGVYRCIIWDITSGTKIVTLSGNSIGISSISWSPDGTKLATASGDKTTIIWDAVSGANLLTLSGHTALIRSVSWSPDGTKVATGSEDESAIIWDAISGAKLLILKGLTLYITSVSWSPDGTKIATGGGDSRCTIWDAASGTMLVILDSLGGLSGALSISWSPDGTKVAVGGLDTTAIICDAKSGVQLMTLSGHSGYLWAIQWSPDGSKLVTGSDDRSAIIWDAASGQMLLMLNGHVESVLSVTWSPDGTKVATGGEDKSLIIWDVASKVNLSTVRNYPYKVNSVSWSPKGTKVAMASEDSTAIIWDAASGLNLLTLRGHTASVLSVTWSPDGSKVVTASADNTSIIWDALTGVKLLTLNGHTKDVASVSWSPDGSRIATGSGDNTCIVWDATSGGKLVTFQGHTGYVTSVAWSPDGTRVASGSGDCTCIIWDAASGVKILTIREQNVMTSVSWSPDGTRVATANADYTAKIWDAFNGLNLQTLRGHTARVTSVSWSPDGSKIATASADKTAKIWLVDDATLQEDESDNVFSIVEPRAKASDIDMRLCLVGTSKDSVVQGFLGNVGTYKCRIDSIYFTGSDSSAFTLVSGFPRYELAVGGSKPAEFRFAPQRVGQHFATINIITQSDTLRQTITGEGIAPALRIVGDIIDFGVVEVGKLKDTLQVITIKNIGSAPLTINTTRHAGPNDVDFSTLAGGGKFTLVPGDTAKLDLRFFPKDIGRTSGRLLFDYNGIGSPATVQLYGEGAASLGINPSILATGSITFDSVCVGDKETRQAFITNNGSVPLQLLRTEWITNTGNVFSTQLLPQLLAVDSTLVVSMNFLPKASGISTAQVRWIADQDTAFTTITGIGKNCAINLDTARTTIIAPNITAKAGEKVNLTLTMTKPTGMEILGAPTEWVARIHYNKSILYNEQTSNVCAGTTDSCALELTGVYDPKTDELISIPCVTTLGNTDYSPIIIDTFFWKNSAIVTEVATQNGSITLNGVCEDGGVRLFIPAKNSTSLSTRPNPAQDNLQIQYGLREPLMVTLELLTMTGQVAQTILTNQSQVAGQYTLTSDLSVLGNGVYLLRLRTNKEMLTTRVDVVK